MLGWFKALMPKEEKFFDLFERHSLTLVSGAEALQGLLKGGDSVLDYCREIARHEQVADDITREVMMAIRRTFVTPFDRGDIKDLITSMDDSIDQMHKTAKAIMLFEVRSFEAPMQEMGDIAAQSARLIVEAAPLLRSMHSNAARLNAITEEITRLEERSDQLHDHGRKELFLRHRETTVMPFIVGDEIYQHLEKIVDRFEDVANEMSAILIEHI